MARQLVNFDPICQQHARLTEILETFPRVFWVLSIMPKIPEISVGIQMEKLVSVSSNRNIRGHLRRWSTFFGGNIPTEIPFLTKRFFALIREFGKMI